MKMSFTAEGRQLAFLKSISSGIYLEPITSSEEETQAITTLQIHKVDSSEALSISQ